ncbi:MAG TPA: glycoside hydrolase family 36 protein, partial [Anaerolineales bacterium]|nr:glycoside hydrolase family 36 protein [Anaerolineales bacterium]
LVFRTGQGIFTSLNQWSSITELPLAEPPHAVRVSQCLALGIGPDSHGLQVRLQFVLLSDTPCLLWNMRVENRRSTPIYLERLDLLRLGLDPGSELQNGWQAPAFFSNGWGSWNHTGTYGLKDRFQRTRLGPLTEPMRVNAGTPHPTRTGRFSSDMFGVLGDRLNRRAVLLGFLSQKQHFGSLQTWLAPPGPTLQLWANGDGARLDPGATLSTDWAALFPLNLQDPDPLQPYLEMVAHHHDLEPGFPQDRQVPVGWCSWYHYYSQVSAADITENLESAQELQDRLPLPLLQIDDGFEAQVGDWFEFNDRFPGGVAPLAAVIHTAGLQPGLWLAPFIVHPRSNLYREHPDWLLRGRLNRPVNAGFSFRDALCTALDLTHPEALDYAAEVVSTAVHNWGFPYLKLDFLYAGALPGQRFDPSLTRAQTFRRGLEALRTAAGTEATLVGCGCPLGPAIGLVEAMRIGADVSESWLPTYAGSPFVVHREPDYPSTRNAIQNSLTRATLHRRWWINDPDCLLV